LVKAVDEPTKRKDYMSKKVEGERPQKVPKTIKVSTVIISVAVFAAIIGALMTGWFMRSSFDATIHAEVVTQVQQLKENQ